MAVAYTVTNVHSLGNLRAVHGTFTSASGDGNAETIGNSGPGLNYIVDYDIKLDTGGAARQIGGKKDSTAVGDAGYLLGVASNETLSFRVADGVDGVNRTGGILTVGTWYVLTGVLTAVAAANDDISLYVDGTLNGPTNSTVMGSLANARPFTIGANSTPAQFFDGDIAFARVWIKSGAAWTTDEITRRVECRNFLYVPSDPHLVLQWVLWAPESAPATAFDHSAQLLDGTYTGTTSALDPATVIPPQTHIVDIAERIIAAAAGGQVFTVTATDQIFLLDRLTKAEEHTLREGLFLRDTVSRIIERTIRDAILAPDSQAKTEEHTLFDRLLVGDQAVRQLERTIRDGLFLLDSVIVQVSGGQVFQVTVTDRLLLLDTAQKIEEHVLREGVLIRDDGYRQIALTLREGLLVSDALFSQALRQVLATDNLLLRDNFQLIIERTLRDPLLLRDTVSSIQEHLHREGLFLVDSVVATLIEGVTAMLTGIRVERRDVLGVITLATQELLGRIELDSVDMLGVTVGHLTPPVERP